MKQFASLEILIQKENRLQVIIEGTAYRRVIVTYSHMYMYVYYEPLIETCTHIDSIYGNITFIGTLYIQQSKQSYH